MAKDSSGAAVLDQPTVTSSALPERLTFEAQQAHEREKAERKKEFERLRPKLTKCVDPEYAEKYEAEKPRFTYDVTITIMERDKETRNLKSNTYHATDIKAQSEDEAWAKACDKVRRWPNRRSTDHKITRLSSAS